MKSINLVKILVILAIVVFAAYVVCIVFVGITIQELKGLSDIRI